MQNELNLITIQEAMDLLHVSRSTIDRWRKFKGLPYIKIGKEIFFNEKDVHAWVKQHTKIEDNYEDQIDQLQTIIIGYQSQTAHMWSSLIMKELRLFEEEIALNYPNRRVNIQWIDATNGLELVEGIISGGVHIASLGDYPIIMSHQISNLLPKFRPVLLCFDGKTSHSSGISLVIPKGKKYRDLFHSRGTTITTVVNSSASHRLNQWLPNTNFDYEIINQDMNSSYSNIMQGCVEASVMWEPYVSLSRLQGARTIDYESINDDYLTGVIAQEQWAQKNDDLVIAYLKAHIRTHQIARSSPLKVAKIISKSIGIQHSISTDIISKVRWDAAVYHQDLKALKNLLNHNKSYYSYDGSPNNIDINYQGYYMDEASKQLNLHRLFDQPLDGKWDAEILY
ncbi:helix-turn-helix domain-containing protein [Salicibibacter cibarius]|uniref:Helix-turn-helix domain-containing protein n=1 Tax=Salicibibacter cibarius TaxID=2743000 RepID=A0A7T6Z5K6_9BACI|nr:helix-turn-helix domain-containing protein [Salicibibacter cibarius]QQK77211.1 helix-turn-helix domain-containing protein [Salicibibacter cibarius]